MLRRFDGSFERFADVDRYDGDPSHVEGAVLIHVDGKQLLTQDEWDELDWLWPLLVQAVEESRATGAGERHLPDQPILFRAERLPPGRLLVSVSLGEERRAAAAKADEFLRAVAAAGLAFFRHRDQMIRGGGRHQREVDLCLRWLSASTG